MPIVHQFIEMLGQYELNHTLLYCCISTQFERVDDHLVV
jgi:hypothetical protein